METTPAEILISETPVAQVVCKACGKPVDCPRDLEKIALRFGVFCDPCADRDNERIKHEAIERSQLIDACGWEKICPLEFQHTEAHKLPSPTKLQKVLAWQYGAKGLVLHGPTRLGKSRCLYQLLKREFKARKTVSVLDHSSAYRYTEMFDEGPSSVRRWIEFRCTVDILALDDVFKARLTDSFEQAIFTIISQRTERGLPVLLTTNDVGDTLKERMSKDRGDALIGRLREFCESISFSV